MLYLHIGTNKAGSTTIQRFIASGAAEATGLRTIGAAGTPNAWKLAAVSGTAAAHKFFVRFGRLSEAEFATLPSTLWQEMAQEASAAPEADHVLSSEFIYTFHRRDEAAITALRDRLTAVFGEVRVLFYCRDQLAYLRSCYAQGVKGKRHATLSLAGYLDKARTSPADWDYHGTLSVWERVFGRDALRIRVMDPAFLTGGDLLSDFLDATGRPPEAAQHLRTRRSLNVSPPPARIEGIRQANKLLSAGPRLQRLYPTARRIADRLPEWALSPLLPDIDAARRHADLFYGTNAAFNERFLADQPDRLPLPPDDGKATA